MKQKPATTNNKGFNTLLPETTLSGLWKTPSTTDDSTEVIAKDCPKTWIECWSDGLNNEIKEEIAKLKGEGK